MSWLAVFVLGGLGALCRVGVVTLLPQRVLPWGTLAVNLVGCLAIGLVFELFEGGTEVAPELRIGLIGGFLGGFTTFSAFGLECWGLVTEGTPGLAAVYAVASLVLGLAGVGLGVWTARALT